MIAIVDYGIGNIQSIRNMLLKLDQSSVFANNPKVLEQSEGFILPGVGAFGEGISKLKASGLIPALEHQVFHQNKPVLGICLGMQMMMTRSSEGQVDGLNWIPGEVRRFPAQIGDLTLRIPHIGWSAVRVKKSSALTAPLRDNSRFYFVHSYYASCADREDVLLESDYGISFDSAISRNNVFGVQFHPEKSHAFGMELLKAFACLTLK